MNDKGRSSEARPQGEGGFRARIYGGKEESGRGEDRGKKEGRLRTRASTSE